MFWPCLFAVLLFIMIPLHSVQACTAVYVGKDLTTDGSTIFARTEDLEPHHNKTFVVKESVAHKKGDIFEDKSTGFKLPLTAEAYQYTALPDVTPNEGIFDEAGTNTYGVMMDATVSCYTNPKILEVDPFVEDGISESSMTSAVLPYVRTAREGVDRLTHIVESHGNAEANALIIADQKETWYVELLSGHQYAAVKLPADRFVVFPNAFFLDTIDTHSKDVIASNDLVSTAKKSGTLVEKNGQIHVSNSYADKVADGTKSRYWRGVHLLDTKSTITLDTPDEELPFYHQTKKKISVQDIMKLQRDRYEGTNYQPQDKSSTGTGKEEKDQEENLPLSKRKGLYPIGNENTMEAHIFQVYSDLPKVAPAIMWEAIGSPLVSPYLPYFGNIQTTAKPYQVTATDYASDSYYWVADRLLTQLMAHEDSMKSAIREDVERFETPYQKQALQWKDIMTQKDKKNPKQAADWITKQTTNMGQDAFKTLKNWEKHYVKD
ncbi:MAG: C69 family dipeptidase [Aerococcus sp.]|nr:C69 family dipeptidase [Aerococcus sp.]